MLKWLWSYQIDLLNQFTNLKVLKRSAKSEKLISFPCVIDPDLRLLPFTTSSIIGSLKITLSNNNRSLNISPCHQWGECECGWNCERSSLQYWRAYRAWWKCLWNFMNPPVLYGIYISVWFLFHSSHMRNFSSSALKMIFAHAFYRPTSSSKNFNCICSKWPHTDLILVIQIQILFFQPAQFRAILLHLSFNVIKQSCPRYCYICWANKDCLFVLL